MNIKLPTKKGKPNTNPEAAYQQIVVIGANGSGKTRIRTVTLNEILRFVIYQIKKPFTLL